MRRGPEEPYRSGAIFFQTAGYEGSIMTRFSRMSVPLLAALAATSTLAADARPGFESLDKNGDGKISLSEASNDDALFVAFKSLDTNKDGELTREEFSKHK